MTNIENQNLTPGTNGIVLHRLAHFYDLMAWVMLFGREQVFRERVVELARLQPGESVLDIGCGTGTLAIVAKQRVGSKGTVYGIDASPEMLAKARKKASKAGLDIIFKNEIVESLSFPDGHFDVVLSTLMLHHLPRQTRQQCAREARRVLKPGGRLLIVDFGASAVKKRGFFSHFHSHGHINLPDIIAMLNEADLNVVESGEVGMNELQFVLSVVPESNKTRGSK